MSLTEEIERFNRSVRAVAICAGFLVVGIVGGAIATEVGDDDVVQPAQEKVVIRDEGAYRAYLRAESDASYYKFLASEAQTQRDAAKAEADALREENERLEVVNDAFYEMVKEKP